MIAQQSVDRYSCVLYLSEYSSRCFSNVLVSQAAGIALNQSQIGLVSQVYGQSAVAAPTVFSLQVCCRLVFVFLVEIADEEMSNVMNLPL